jgi:hypothetical protein
MISSMGNSDWYHVFNSMQNTTAYVYRIESELTNTKRMSTKPNPILSEVERSVRTIRLPDREQRLRNGIGPTDVEVEPGHVKSVIDRLGVGREETRLLLRGIPLEEVPEHDVSTSESGNKNGQPYWLT